MDMTGWISGLKDESHKVEVKGEVVEFVDMVRFMALLPPATQWYAAVDVPG